LRDPREGKVDRPLSGKPEHKSPYGWEVALALCLPEDTPLLEVPPEQEEREAVTDVQAEQRDVTRRYDRMAFVYDIYDAPMEWMGIRRRRRGLVAQVEGRVLEAGVGTGKNIPFYPADVEVTAIDVSAKMLARAEGRSRALGREVRLELADVTDLPYPDGSFDTTVATSVFCSVADPVSGLRELGRVTKPNGRILLLEHVRPRSRVGGWLADVATFLTRRLFGFNANRRTEENVSAAGLVLTEVERNGIWRTIIAVPPAAMSERKEEKS
jgi:ubiquinone/menaquinone biosynthesis C-methylase UbiE